MELTGEIFYEQGCGVSRSHMRPTKLETWKMKAAKDAGEEYNDPTLEDNILGRNETRSSFWEEHLKNPTVALGKALTCVEKLCRIGVRSSPIAQRRPRGGRSVVSRCAFFSSFFLFDPFFIFSIFSCFALCFICFIFLRLLNFSFFHLFFLN